MDSADFGSLWSRRHGEVSPFWQWDCVAESLNGGGNQEADSIIASYVYVTGKIYVSLPKDPPPPSKPYLLRVL